jgi:exodeoxyribonuclease V alpha subunit
MSADGQSFETAALELLRPTCGRQLDSILPLLSPLPLTALDTLTLGDLLALSDKGRDVHLTVVLAWLFAALNEGSVCLKLDSQSLTETHLPEQVEAAGEHLQAFIASMDAGAYLGLVDEAGALSGAPLVRVKGQAAVDRPDLLYFQRFYRHEVRLKTRLERFLDGGAGPLCDPGQIEALVADLWRSERVIRLGPARKPLVADPWQQSGLGLMMKRGLTVISGGPGTGKTSLMVNMLRLLTTCGVGADEICLTAPTGRAAQRMREAVQLYLPGIAAISEAEKALLDIEAGTLHKLLRYGRRSQSFHYHAGHPLPARAVIVDEVSMIDVGMLDQLLQAIDPARTRLILLGDKDQLPSVQAGAVFASLMPQSANAVSHDEDDDSKGGRGHRFSNHLVVLQTSYRSGKRLLALAAAVKRGRLPSVAPLPMAVALEMPVDSFATINLDSPADGPGEGLGATLGHALSQWADHYYASPSGDDGSHYLQLAAKVSGNSPDAMGKGDCKPVLRSLFEHLARARILTVARHGPLGCVALNRLVMGHLVGRHGLVCDPGTGLFCGAPVLLTRNDYVRQLFNGDVGVALWDQAGALRVYVQRGDSFISASVTALSGWEPAFATTVHKSQGSEYAHVLLVFPGDPRHRLLTREILYTGITRARERLLLVAGAQELQTAIENRIRRNSGLMW